MIEELKKVYENLLKKTDISFCREIWWELCPDKYWPIALIGERGVGKTYLLLQKLKEQKEKTFYFSADNPLIKWISLFQIVSDLYFDYWIKYLVIDEIHKWENWITNLKAIIDSFPDLKLIVSWSSSLDLYKGTADLQRRIYKLNLFPLSFCEYLKYEKNIEIPSFSFMEIIEKHKEISFDLANIFNENDFKCYLDHGFFPYYKVKNEIYHNLLLNNLQKTLLEDLPTFMNLQTSSLSKLEKLFYFIAKNLPSELNYKSLAEKIWISKDLLESIIVYLDQIWVLNIAIRTNKLTDIIRKEFKIFLGNPNIYYAYQSTNNIWTIRECFVLNILKQINKSLLINDNILLPEFGDLIYTYKWNQYYFEIWWKNKTKKQLQNMKNSFIVVDDVIWSENKIPLRLFWLIDPKK